MEDIYDVVIIGAGPAGMNAALYTSRANLKTLMIEKECPGGKMLKTQVIDNYIGGSSNNAMQLASNMFNHSIKYGAKYKQGNVVSIENENDTKIVVLSNGERIKSTSIILAIGGNVSKKQFEYDHYLNKGLSYCVVCDANFYKDKVVAIIGNNKSIDDVSYLANIAREVIFINKDDSISNRENVRTIIKEENYKLLGDKKIEELVVSNQRYKIDGAFYVEDTNNFNGFINQLETENGFIKVDQNMHTNIKGIFACGDIISKPIKQVISACGDGALAALETIKYVNKNK